MLYWLLYGFHVFCIGLFCCVAGYRKFPTLKAKVVVGVLLMIGLGLDFWIFYALKIGGFLDT
jgi:hypothetical protein